MKPKPFNYLEESNSKEDKAKEKANKKKDSKWQTTS